VYRKLIIALPLVVATMMALSGTARAACPIDDPDCDPGPGTVTKTLHVVDSSQAALTATGINCGVAGNDCTESYTYTIDEEPPSVTLTASGVPAGYTARLFKCTTTVGSTCVGGGTGTECGVGSCTFEMDANYLVRLSVADETAPSATTVSGPSKVGPSVRHFTASASDGAGVVSYRFYLDGVDQGLYGPVSGFDVPVDTLPEGSHTVTARGRDAAGNEGPLSADKAITVDRSTQLTGVSTPPAFTQSAPNVSFTPPPDVGTVVCRTKFGGNEVGSTSSCTSPYSPQGIDTDGQYTIELAVSDDVGNAATVTKTFTLDRGAPNLTVTAPANGAVIGGPFTPSTSGSDGFSDVTFSCRIDSGAFGSCTSLAPSDGAHTVTVRASDAAGNTTDQQRSFTYDSHAPAVSITGGPGEGTVVYARSTAYTFTTSDLTPVTRTCQLDGGAIGPCTSATGHSLSGLSLGIHTFTLRVTDAAGNRTTAIRRFTVADRPAGSGGGGGTGSGGAGSGTISPPVKLATVTTFWKLFGKRTQVGTLTLSHVPKGAKVTVTCKGKGCAFKKLKLSARRAKIKLAKRFKKRKLAAKTVIAITISTPAGSKRFRYALRAGKFPKRSIK
jgi:Big-like domain-containing protein